MDVEFADDRLGRLERDAGYTMGLSRPLVRAYRKCMNLIRSVANEQELYRWRGGRFEKLKGDMSGKRSLRLNDQFRLIVSVVTNRPNNRLRIIAIKDYH